MPHAAPPPPPAPVAVLGPCAPLSEQSTPWEIFIALARVGMQFLSRFLPHRSVLATSYPRHWHVFLESTTSLLRVLLTVRFAPERITLAQLRRLWRARQLIESLLGRPLFPLGARTSPSATTPSPAASATSSPHPPSSAPLGTPISRLAAASASNSASAPATVPTPAISQPRPPSTPSVPEVPFCFLSHFPSRSSSDSDSDTPSSSESSSPSRSRAHKRAPLSLQSIIAQLESLEAKPQAAAPHSAAHIPHSSMPPFIPDVGTLSAALKSDTLPPNCAGALLDKPGDTLVNALEQVHALLQAFPQLSPSQSPSPSPSPSPSQSEASSVGSVHNVHPVHPVHPVHDVHNVHPSHSLSLPHSHSPPP